MSRKIEPEWASEVRPKHMTSLPNEENKKPQGGGAKRRLLGAAPKAPPCCFPFGKDFLCSGLTSEAHSGSIFIEIARFSEFSQWSSGMFFFSFHLLSHGQGPLIAAMAIGHVTRSLAMGHVHWPMAMARAIRSAWFAIRV